MSSDESISIYQAIVKVGDGERRDVYEGDEVDEDGNDKAMRPGEASSTRRLNNRWNRLANGGNEFWMLLTRFMAALEFSRMVLPTIYGRKQQNLLTGGNIKKEGEVPPGIIFVKAGVFLREDAGRLLPEPVSTGNKDPVRIGFLENDKIGLGQTKEKFSHRCKRLLGGGTSLAGTAARRLLRGKVKRGAAIGSQTGKLPVSKQLIHEKSRPRGGALTAHYDLSVYEILNRLCNIQRLYLSGTKMLLSSKGLKRLQNLSKSKESRDPGTGDIVKAEKEKRTAHTLFTELSPDSEKRISGQEIGAAGADGVALTARNNSETASVEDQEGAPGDRDTFLRDSHDSYIKRKAKKYAKDLPFTERWPLNMQLYKKYLFHKRNLMGKKSDAKDEQKLAQKSLEKLKLAAEKGREIELKTENAPGIHQKGDPGAPAIKDDLPAAPPEKLKGPEVSKSNVPKVGVDTPPPTGLLGTTDRYGFFISGPETSDYPADFLEKMNAQTYLLHRKSKPRHANHNHEASWEALVQAWDDAAEKHRALPLIIWPKTRLSDFASIRSRRITNLCKSGIPDRLRGKVWYRLADCDSSKVDGLFDEMLDKSRDPEASAQMFDVIERDITRCYPRHTMFVDKYGPGQANLRDVLKAYALHQPEVGYCQGMGMLVGVMLMHLSPEDSFWLLVQTLSVHLEDYYTPGLSQLKIDAGVFDILLKKLDKKIFKHFEDQGVTSIMYITKWFLTLYTTTLPWEIVLRVWDLFYAEGIKSLFRVGLAVIRLNSTYLLEKCPTNSEILSFLLNIPRDKVVPERLIECTLSIKLKRKSIKKLRDLTRVQQLHH